jgi:hypothetical protein
LLLLFVMVVSSKRAPSVRRCASSRSSDNQQPAIIEIKGEAMDRQSLTARDLGKTRRRRVLAIVAVLGAIAMVLPALAGAAGGAPDSPTPSKNIYSYALFAWDSLMVKGKNGAKVVDGNVGVNNPNGTLSICANGAVEMNAGTSIAGDNLSISKLCKLHDVYYGTGKRPSVLDKVSHHGSAAFTPPINPTNVPVFPTGVKCKLGKPYVKTNDGTIYSPSPGVYSGLEVKDGKTIGKYNTVKLQAGTYVFCNIKLGKDVWFDLEPNTTVVVTGTVSISNESAIGHAQGHPQFGGVGNTDNAQWFVRGDQNAGSRDPGGFPCQIKPSAYEPTGETTYGKCESGVHVGFSKHTYVRSSFFARNGQLNLGHDTDLHGRFWAKGIGSDVGTRVDAPPPTVPPTTTTTSLPETTTPTTPPTTVPTTVPPTTPPTTPPTVPPTTPTVPPTTPPTVPPTTPPTVRPTFPTTTLPET